MDPQSLPDTDRSTPARIPTGDIAATTPRADVCRDVTADSVDAP